MDKKSQISELIKQLEYVKERPGMYMDKDIKPINNFLSGFWVACCALMWISTDYDSILREVVSDRGWETTNQALTDQMDEKKMDEDSIRNEMLTISIEVWKKTLDSIEGK